MAAASACRLHDPLVSSSMVSVSAEPWLSELSELSERLSELSDPVGPLSDCRTARLSEPCRSPVGHCRTPSESVGRSMTGSTPCRTLSDSRTTVGLSELSELSDCRTPVGHLSDTVGPLSEPLVHNTPRAPTLSLTLSSSWRRRPSPSWHPSCSGCRLLPVSNNRLLPVRGAQVPCVVAALAVRQSGVQRTVRLVERGMLAPKEGQKVVHEVQSICCDSIFG